VSFFFSFREDYIGYNRNIILKGVYVKMFGAVTIVGKAVAMIGVDVVISNVIKATAPVAMGVVEKTCMRIGGLVISSMVGNAVVKHIDEIVEPIEKFFKHGEDKLTEEIKEDAII